jgi:hypothetical protein
MGTRAFILLTAFLVMLEPNLHPGKADIDSFDAIRIDDIQELQIPPFQPGGAVDWIDWSDSDKILFNVSDHWGGKFSHIYIVDADGRNFKKLTSGNRKCTHARWILSDKIAYSENNKLSIMDTDGNAVSGLFAEEVRNACRNPWLLSDKYGLIQDRGTEIVLRQGEISQRSVTIPEHNTRWLRAQANFPGLISDAGSFVLSQARPQYKMLLQRIDLKDGRVHDLALYSDPSSYCGRNFSCSGDGNTIVYIAGFEIWTMTASGSNSHRVYPDSGKSPQYGPITFSPKDDKIAFSSRELKGDRKWRIWIATLRKDVRPATVFDRLEAIIISETLAAHTIDPGDISSLKKEPDERISISEEDFDTDAEKELLVLLQRGEEKSILVLNYKNGQYVPIWTERCFLSSDIQTLDINKTDKVTAIAIHTDVAHHGIKDDCRIYKLSDGKMEQIWHQMLTNVYSWGYKGELTLSDGPGYRDLIAAVKIYYRKPDSLVIPIDEPIEKIELLYRWNGKQYVGDEIEQRVDSIRQKLRTE